MTYKTILDIYPGLHAMLSRPKALWLFDPST